MDEDRYRQLRDEQDRLQTQLDATASAGQVRGGAVPDESVRLTHRLDEIQQELARMQEGEPRLNRADE